MITLDATLQSALDGSFHKPIVKIVSTSAAADIPFDGNLFNLDATEEGDTGFKALSTGQLALTYRKGNDLRYIVSDTGRTSWSDVLLYDGDGTSKPVQDAAFVELASGNLGVIFITLTSGTYRLFRMVVTPAGAVVTSATEIANTTNVIDAPSLCATATGFLLVYKHYDSTGPTYSLYKRTCDATFATWSGESAITLTGLVAGQEKNHAVLLAAASGRIYLFFDYVDDIQEDKTQANLYQVYSTDNGATWSAPSALTTYTGFSTSAVHPAVSEKTTGDIILAFHEKRSVITIGSSSAGWDSNCVIDDAGWVHYDPASGKVFVVLAFTQAGLPILCGIIVIDTATWTVEKAYTQTGSPGYNSYWIGNNVSVSREIGGIHADGQLVAIGSAGAHLYNSRALMVVDHSTETIREYWFETNATFGYQRNVSATWEDAYIEDGYLRSVFVDGANSRVYVAIEVVYGSQIRVKIGYFDLTEAADPITGMYEFHDLIFIGPSEIVAFSQANYGLFLRVYPAEDRVVISACCESVLDPKGYLKVFALSTGSEIKSYTVESNTGFHRNGLRWPVLINNKVYGGIKYTADDYQGERRGLMIVDLLNDTVIYERPTFASADDYGLADLKPIDGGLRIIMASLYYGVVFYDVAAHTWTLYDGANVPGFPNADGSYGTARVSYDETNNFVFTMDQSTSGINYSLVAFVEGGLFFLGKYMVGTLSGADYTFGSIADLTLDSGALDLAVAYDDDDVLWATWTKLDYSDNEQSIQWDRDAFSPDLSDYLVAGSPVTLAWEIGKISRAEFTLARGDLFDPANLASILAPVVAKGRTIEIWLGENVAGLDYWQSQGKRLVTGTAMDFRRTDHPTITVVCDDPSVFWPEMVITATSAYSDATFANVFADLMDQAQLEASEYLTPTLANAHNIYMQWVDEAFREIMDDLCNHFGCFGYWLMDGRFTLLPIDLAAAVAHTYGTRDKLLDWTADDRYGSFVNRVTVRCEGHEFLEVLWDEERVGSKNGTIGFWTKNETHIVYFSEDRTRRCRYVRMNVIQSVNNYGPLLEFLGMQGQEEITAIDPNETWVEVSIESPDRAMYALGFAALVLGIGTAALLCGNYYTPPCGPYILATNLALSILISILTAVANFQYDFYARPVGHEKQMYQATVDDTAFQQQLGGKVIAHEMDDALSYTVEHCRMVAQHEIDVLSGQRNRVAFRKIAHLQDELGDVLQVVHPVSAQALKVFVAKLQRIFNRPSAGGVGEFSDRIEGWRIL